MDKYFVNNYSTQWIMGRICILSNPIQKLPKHNLKYILYYIEKL